MIWAQTSDPSESADAGSGTVEILEALTPVVAVVLSFIGLLVTLFVQARSHKQEIERLTLTEGQKRSTRRREMILEQVEPMLPLFDQGTTAFHRLTNFITHTFEFAIFRWPGMGSDESRSGHTQEVWLLDHIQRTGGLPEEEINLEDSIKWYAEQNPDLDEEDIQNLNRPWYVKAEEAWPQLDFGHYTVQIPDDLDLRQRLRTEPSAGLLASGFEGFGREDELTREGGFMRPDLAKEAIQVLLNVSEQLTPAISRAQIFGFERLHAALAKAEVAASGSTMPANLCIQTSLGDEAEIPNMKWESINLHLVDKWFLGHYQNFFDAADDVIEALREIIGEEDRAVPEAPQRSWWKRRRWMSDEAD